METTIETPGRETELQEEINLLSWVIEKAVIAHDSAETFAQNKGKPIQMSALRIVLQAQAKRMHLRGFGAGTLRNPTPKDTKLLVEQAQQLLSELAPQQMVSPIPDPLVPLNRSQRRAMEREQKKRRAA